MSLAATVKQTESSSMTLSSEGISVSMRIPAEESYISNTLLTVREICDYLCISSDRTSRIVLSLEEALMNAIEHAYSTNDGLIDLNFLVEGDDFVVTVEDYGRGLNFESDLSSYHQGISEGQALQDRGRGISIIRGVSDDFQLDALDGHGTKVTMMFHI